MDREGAPDSARSSSIAEASPEKIEPAGGAQSNVLHTLCCWHEIFTFTAAVVLGAPGASSHGNGGVNVIELLAEARLECTRRGVPAGGRGKIRNRKTVIVELKQRLPPKSQVDGRRRIKNDSSPWCLHAPRGEAAGQHAGMPFRGAGVLHRV